MNDETMDELLTDLELARFSAQSAMRGCINTVGFDTATGVAAAELAESVRDIARIEGTIRAAFEAGMLHQLNTGRVS